MATMFPRSGEYRMKGLEADLTSSSSLVDLVFGPKSIRKLQVISFISAVLSVLCLIVFAASVYFNLINVSFNYQRSDIIEFTEQFKYTARWQLVPITWLLHTIFTLVVRRFRTLAWNPMASEYDEITREDQNILTNTIEQTVLSLATQYILIACCSNSPQIVLKVIPFMNLTFIFGRICFWAGYPKYRLFGFLFTFIPSAAVIKFCWSSVLGLNKFIGIE